MSLLVESQHIKRPGGMRTCDRNRNCIRLLSLRRHFSAVLRSTESLLFHTLGNRCSSLSSLSGPCVFLLSGLPRAFDARERGNRMALSASLRFLIWNLCSINYVRGMSPVGVLLLTLRRIFCPPRLPPSIPLFSFPQQSHFSMLFSSPLDGGKRLLQSMQKLREPIRDMFAK